MVLGFVPKALGLAVLTLVAVLENFGYRQLANLWRLRGWWQFIRKQQGWGRSLGRASAHRDQTD